MMSSSAASTLKQEQVDASKLQEGVLNNLELRLGISSDNGLCGGGGTTNPWLGIECTLGACLPGKTRQPWSKLSRGLMSATYKEKIASTGRMATSVHIRKNLPATSTRHAYSEDLSKVEPCSEEEDHENTEISGQERLAMFVKVNLEGYAVGRKIDINAHHGYTSLSGALQSMFHGFLSDGHGRITTREDEEQLDYQKGNGMMKNYILLYEDNEGDRMLVGDVPWELFIASVKRLYITKDPRADKRNKKNNG